MAKDHFAEYSRKMQERDRLMQQQLGGRDAKRMWDSYRQKKMKYASPAPIKPKAASTAMKLYIDLGTQVKAFYSLQSGTNTYLGTGQSVSGQSMPYKFKLGDKVKIRRDSPYSGQSDKVGEIVERHPGNDLAYRVRFPNRVDRYGTSDLELATEEPRPIVDFDSVVLADEKKKAILEALNQVDKHDLIFNKWGFGSVFEKGTAISLLFYGEPGTGKTLMAQAIADKFDYKLTRIGTAEIESSEPGGAERAIRTFFEQADKKTILLFDECDSLLYNRKDVGSILAAQVNQLLQSLENHEGIVIFTTNRLGTLDEALNRRLSLKLEFEMPDAEHRIKIWRRMFPKKAPLALDVKWDELASIEVTGGYIKNAVLRAVRMAAAEEMDDKDKQITHVHLVRALKQEVRSMVDFEDAREPSKPRVVGGAHMGVRRSGSDVKRTVEMRKNNDTQMS